MSQKFENEESRHSPLSFGDALHTVNVYPSATAPIEGAASSMYASATESFFSTQPDQSAMWSASSAMVQSSMNGSQTGAYPPIPSLSHPDTSSNMADISLASPGDTPFKTQNTSSTYNSSSDISSQPLIGLSYSYLGHTPSQPSSRDMPLVSLSPQEQPMMTSDQSAHYPSIYPQQTYMQPSAPSLPPIFVTAHHEQSYSNTSTSGTAPQQGLPPYHTQHDSILVSGPATNWVHHGEVHYENKPVSPVDQDWMHQVQTQPSSYTVSIGQPVKMIGQPLVPGLDGSYFVFPITSSAMGLGGYPGTESTVRRRFKDFVALQDLLQALYPGHCIPPRPKRNLREGRRKHPYFIEDRRMALERYLKRLATHQTISRGEALRLFLQHPGGELRSCEPWLKLLPGGSRVSGHMSSTPGSTPKLLLASMLRNTSQFFKDLVGQPDPPAPQEILQPPGSLQVMREKVSKLTRSGGVMIQQQTSPQDRLLQEESIKVSETKKLLKILSAKARNWTHCCNEHSSAMSDLARALQVLGSYEGSVGFIPHGVCQLHALSDGCLRVSKLSSLASEHSSHQLSFIDDYVKYMSQAQAAFKYRESMKSRTSQLETDLARRRSQMAIVVDTPSQFSKREQLMVDIPQLESAVEVARTEVARVSQLNIEETSALKRHMANDLVAMLREFALIQVASNQKTEQLWREALENLSRGTPPSAY
ncbi:hypothetical protein CEUSTIGMA_g11294.t1 [Chlamydomonas eustigma]|uniref:PX domain-containing protein n=1 Tax=Chlamydomonas eustigma TaxID=1157962 RepID=A0A250XLR1_9CHLO|nr:hypothetical protein CEUSTIGMA_g11294.t1 [Chlamydomonas eustigma]|eukprot:GAX83869.1 hypothetical protein CEUSTIGMA_g11294.t1 [Chlamydomonas eustigma]